jgi:hypothetical protein
VLDELLAGYGVARRHRRDVPAREAHATRRLLRGRVLAASQIAAAGISLAFVPSLGTAI